MSRTTADEARIRRESTVDMMAARTTTRKIPVKTGGNRDALISGSTVSGSRRPGKRILPAIPERTAPTSKPMTQRTAMNPPSTICF
jgi:hypothetical protein